MFLSFKALEQCSVKVQLKKDGVQLTPNQTWPQEACDHFQDLGKVLSLSGHEMEEVTVTISEMMLMRTIRECLVE